MSRERENETQIPQLLCHVEWDRGIAPNCHYSEIVCHYANSYYNPLAVGVYPQVSASGVFHEKNRNIDTLFRRNDTLFGVMLRPHIK